MALTVDSAREAAEALERRNAEEREAERAAVTAALEEYERSRDEERQRARDEAAALRERLQAEGLGGRNRSRLRDAMTTQTPAGVVMGGDPAAMHDMYLEMERAQVEETQRLMQTYRGYEAERRTATRNDVIATRQRVSGLDLDGQPVGHDDDPHEFDDEQEIPPLPEGLVGSRRTGGVGVARESSDDGDDVGGSDMAGGSGTAPAAVGGPAFEVTPPTPPTGTRGSPLPSDDPYNVPDRTRTHRRRASHQRDTLAMEYGTLKHRSARKREDAAAALLQATWRGFKTRAMLAEAGQIIPRQKRSGSLFNLGDVEHYETDQYANEMVCRVEAISKGLLLAKLVQPNFAVSDLARVVALSHTNFMKSATLARYMTDVFAAAVREGDGDLAVQKRVMSVFEEWLTADKFACEDATVMPILDELWAAAAESTDADVVDLAERLQDHATTAAAGAGTSDSSGAFGEGTHAYPASILPTAETITTLFDVHPLEIARQLALMTEDIYASIKPREFLHQAWAKRGASVRAPNVVLMIDKFNDVCHWAATEVLLGTEARDRAETICMLLEVATHSRELNDFSTTMAILTALESASIARLHQSLDIIPLQSQLILDELKTLMSMENNYHKYREAFRRAPAPALPYLGVFLQDLTFIDDGNDDTVSHAGSDLVNIEKQRMTVAVVDDLLAKRAETYCLHDVLTVQAYLDNCEKWDESAQYQKSLERAPRGGQRKKSRRLSISDMRSLSAHRERTDGSEPSAMMEEGFIAELRQNMEMRSFDEGEYIVRKGEPGRSMMFISKGVVRFEFGGDRSKKMNQGQFFGEVALFSSSGLRTASAVAHTDVEVLELTKEDCDRVMRHWPRMQAQFQQVADAHLAADRKGAKGTVLGWMKRLASSAD